MLDMLYIYINTNLFSTGQHFWLFIFLYLDRGIGTTEHCESPGYLPTYENVVDRSRSTIVEQRRQAKKIEDKEPIHSQDRNMNSTVVNTMPNDFITGKYWNEFC